MPRVCGLCGSSSVSHFAWCLRWIATHSFVTMPVVSQSQKRKKCDGIACSSSARCACARCRKIVTAAIVMWVATSVNRTISHPLQPKSPFASQLSTASDIDIRKSMNPAFVQRQNGG